MKDVLIKRRCLLFKSGTTKTNSKSSRTEEEIILRGVIVTLAPLPALRGYNYRFSLSVSVAEKFLQRKGNRKHL
jgi:hypothetical protein